MAPMIGGPTPEEVAQRAEPTPSAGNGPSTRAGMAHLRALDGLRGVAVLAVVLYHFAPGLAPGGFLGVDIFFVLSGFLITSLLVREWEATRRIVAPAFWARRARRLLPALFLVLAAVGLYSAVRRATTSTAQCRGSTASPRSTTSRTGTSSRQASPTSSSS